MKDASESTMLTHCRNLLTLSQKQLAAINKLDHAAVDHYLAQKQLIIEEIKKIEKDIFTSALRPEAEGLLKEILSLEAESSLILKNQQETMRLKLITANKTQTLQSAYESPFTSGTIVNQNK